MARKIVIQGPAPADRGRTFILKAQLRIGRHPTNYVSVSDNAVSRRHAAILFRQGTVLVCDLGSSNGTYVNGRRISGEQPLNAGDVVRVGSTELAYRDA